MAAADGSPYNQRMSLVCRRPVEEREAQAPTARIYHEMKQTLRVTGVGFNLRAWAAYDRFFAAMWEAVRPNCETRAFEEAASRIRAEAVSAADHIGRVGALARAGLGESQAYQAEASLMLYHYLDPKLLLLTSAVRLALEGRAHGRGEAPPGAVQLIERGAPARMAILEAIGERGAEPEVRRTFRDIRRTLGFEAARSDFRTFALWPRYLSAGWEGLKPLARGGAYDRAARHLGEVSRALARSLPYPAPLALDELRRQGEDVEGAAASVSEFEAMLPKLVLNASLLALDWRAPELLRRSPFPARPRTARGGAH